MLLQWGADPKIRNEEGLTPFELTKDFQMRWVTFHGKTYGSGWLHYYISDSAVKGWDRYFVVITADTLYLHHKEPPNRSGGGESDTEGGESGKQKQSWINPAYVIVIRDATVRLHLKSSLRRNAFEIALPGGVIHLLSVSNNVSLQDQESLLDWVEKIQRRVQALKGPTSPSTVVNLPSTVAQLHELHETARMGDVKKLRQLVSNEGRQLDCALGSDGRTPLHIAVKYNKLEVKMIVSLYLSLIVNITFSTDGRDTATARSQSNPRRQERVDSSAHSGVDGFLGYHGPTASQHTSESLVVWLHSDSPSSREQQPTSARTLAFDLW